MKLRSSEEKAKIVELTNRLAQICEKIWLLNDNSRMYSNVLVSVRSRMMLWLKDT